MKSETIEAGITPSCLKPHHLAVTTRLARRWWWPFRLLRRTVIYLDGQEWISIGDPIGGESKPVLNPDGRIEHVTVWRPEKDPSADVFKKSYDAIMASGVDLSRLPEMVGPIEMIPKGGLPAFDGVPPQE